MPAKAGPGMRRLARRLTHAAEAGRSRSGGRGAPGLLYSADMVKAVLVLTLAALLLAGCGSPADPVEKGDGYLAQGEHQRAIEQYGEAIRLDPQDAVAYNQRGVAYVGLGQPERALQDFDEAIRLNPRHACWPSPSCDWPSGPSRSLWKGGPERLASFHSNRGLAYNELGRRELALQDFDEAIRLDPQLAQAYHGRGLVYRAIGQVAEGDRDIAKARELGY